MSCVCIVGFSYIEISVCDFRFHVKFGVTVSGVTVSS